MQLENFKSAWKQTKAINGLQPMGDIEALILSFELEVSSKSKRKWMLVNMALFLVMIFFIQGG